MMLPQVQGSRLKGLEEQFIIVLLCSPAHPLTCFCSCLTSEPLNAEPLNQIYLVDDSK
jgi:hypothetical protein